ncbi:DNA-3-methyladenine glycosylase I [bacterium]|nr:DNA-3-methyladenine glycosylase I [bacterium]
MKRCQWCLSDPSYIKYHDEEWGRPIKDDQKLFEFLVLESMQAGLSWLTILKKRENFRQAFANFDIEKVAKFDEEDVNILLQNPGIIRNKLKIRAAINNAQRILEVQREFSSFSNYIWSYVHNKPIINNFTELHQIPASTPLSDLISKDLKKRGFKFIGTTIIYSFMQAVGMVNDHVVDCFTRDPE